VKKILVTGSSGQIGSYIVDYFSSKYDIIGLDIRESTFERINEITVIGDIGNKEIVNNLVKDVDVVIHTAAQLDIMKSIEDPVFDAELNIIGTVNLLDAARKNDSFSKFIYLSTAAVYGVGKYLPIDENHPLHPVSPYGLSKMTGENYCGIYNQLFNLPVVVLRPFNLYSAREDVSKRFVSVINRFIFDLYEKGKITIHGDGSQKRDFIHVKDVISFIEKIISDKTIQYDVFNLGNGHPLSILDIANLVIEISGGSIEDPLLFEKIENLGKSNSSYADISKAVNYGFKPKISIQQGIKDIIGEKYGK
jgi:UDP-glucose 4-epimerase